MKFLPLIWSSLWRKKARTTFTLLSIVIAFLLFGLLQGVNAWLYAFSMGSNTNRLYVVSRVSQVQPLPSAYLQQIEAVRGIRRALLLALAGGAIGGCLAWLLFNGQAVSTNGGGLTQLSVPLAVDLSPIGVGVLWACIIGMVGAAFPAIRAARAPLAAALRGI